MRKIDGIINKFCMGCSACFNICPTDAIEMKYNYDGFLIPYITEDKCVLCGKCDKVCPIIQYDKTVLPKCYAAWADDDTRFESSSGGAFSVLATNIINNGGIVFGAAWDEDFFVSHIDVNSLDDLSKLYRSKYVQSNIGNTFSKVKDFLNNNIEVMYVGTPCQIAGLNSFLEGCNQDKLILVDFICYYNPPIKLIRKFIDDNFGIENVKSFNFRSKKDGWLCHATEVIYKNGTTETNKNISPYFQGYFNGLYARDACNNCKYSGGHHLSDITLGDFWKIENHDKSWNDGKGTSMIIVRSKKGQSIVVKNKNNFKRLEECPHTWIREGQTNCKKAHPGREYFNDLIKYKNFNDAVEYSLKGIFDVGFVCVQSYENYGSALTNLAMYHVLKDLKKSVLFITQPLSSEIKPSKNINFQRKPWKDFEEEESFANQEEMKKLNDKCKMFLVGSDQMFNYEIYKRIDGFTKLDWVDEKHKKISYSTSFGRDIVFGNSDERKNFKESLKRFDAISLREHSGVSLLQNEFGIQGTQVIDPVFLCDKKYYIELASCITTAENYIFAYILDPDMKKGHFLKNIAEKLNKKLIVMVDRWMDKEYIETIWDIPTMVKQKNESWIAHLLRSDLVITDSFHGLCFSVIFKREFVVLNNQRRGTTRFESLLEMLDLKERLFNNEEEAFDFLLDLNKIDYLSVEEKLEIERNRGLEWLKNNII